MHTREALPQLILHRGEHIVPVLHAPRARHQHMELNELLMPRHTSANLVNVNAPTPIAVRGQNLVHRHAVLALHGLVHQAVTGIAQQLETSDQDVYGHRQRDNRVEPPQASNPHQSHTRQNTGGGPHIGHKMLAVGGQRQGVMLAPGPKQNQRHRTTNHRGNHGHDEAQADLLNRLRVHQTLDRDINNRRRRHEDHGTFQPGREVLCLGMAELMVAVRGPRDNLEHNNCDNCRNQIDNRLRRVGKQAHRSGQSVAPKLQRDGDDRRPH